MYPFADGMQQANKVQNFFKQIHLPYEKNIVGNRTLYKN